MMLKEVSAARQIILSYVISKVRVLRMGSDQIARTSGRLFHFKLYFSSCSSNQPVCRIIFFSQLQQPLRRQIQHIFNQIGRSGVLRAHTSAQTILFGRTHEERLPFKRKRIPKKVARIAIQR